MLEGRVPALSGGDPTGGDAPRGRPWKRRGEDQPERGALPSSYDEGWVGGEPAKLIKLPGEPSIPACGPLRQSCRLGDVLVPYDVVETASSRGDGPG